MADDDASGAWGRIVALERELARARAELRADPAHSGVIRAALGGDIWDVASACTYLGKFTDEVLSVVPLLVDLAVPERSRHAAVSCLVLSRHRAGVVSAARHEVMNLPMGDADALRRGAELLWDLGDREGVRILKDRIRGATVAPALLELCGDLDEWGE